MPALATGFRMPLSGTLSLTNEYGVAGGLSTYPTYKHLGEDYGGAKGTPILAAANGRVLTAQTGTTGFGNYVIIEHTLPDYTKIYSLYAHMDFLSVGTGDIYIGTQIGGMGRSGEATGIHLHFEISKKNLFTNPGMYGKGYDSPSDFVTSSKYTVDPSNFVRDHPVTNVQIGGSQADQLWGLSTNETIMGGGGNDTLVGNGGIDILIGGEGRDTLYGGSSGDFFDFNAPSESKVGISLRDLILDFQSGDKIDLKTMDANTKASGDQAFKYIGSQQFHGVAGELSTVSGIVRGDVNGDKTADFEIEVRNVQTLLSGDFVL